jgi:hypothetical protein
VSLSISTQSLSIPLLVGLACPSPDSARPVRNASHAMPAESAGGVGVAVQEQATVWAYVLFAAHPKGAFCLLQPRPSIFPTPDAPCRRVSNSTPHEVWIASIIELSTSSATTWESVHLIPHEV